MSRAIVHSTQIAVSLSLNIQMQNEYDTHLMTLPLVSLTTLFFALWSIRENWGRFWFNLTILVTDIQEAITFTGKVLTIGLNSLAYGLGVTV